MISTLVKFEIRALLRDRAIWSLTVLFSVLVALSTSNGLRLAKFQLATLKVLGTEEIQNLAQARALAEEILRGEKEPPRGWWNNPADVRGFALSKISSYVVKPPAPLAALAMGQSDVLPYYVAVKANTRRSTVLPDELENPRRLLLGRFDLAFVVIYLAPLFLLALGHSVLAAEKERGVLPMVAANPVRLSALGAVQLGVRGAFLLGAGLLAFAGTLIFGDFDFGASGVGSGFLSFLGISFGYLGFWIAIIVFVVARGWSSATNAFVLTGVWLVLTVIVPWSLNLTAKLLHPVPSRAEFILAQRAAIAEAETIRGQILAGYLHDHPELRPKSTKVEDMHYTAMDIATSKVVETQLQPVQTLFEEQLTSQQALIDLWQFLSPAAIAQQALTDIAGSGWSRHLSFLAQLDRYLGVLQNHFYPQILSGEYRYNEFDHWPRYRWEEPALRSGQLRSLTALFALLSIGGIVAVLGWRQFQRYSSA